VRVVATKHNGMGGESSIRKILEKEEEKLHECLEHETGF